jgi:hypothetical protein
MCRVLGPRSGYVSDLVLMEDEDEDRGICCRRFLGFGARVWQLATCLVRTRDLQFNHNTTADA